MAGLGAKGHRRPGPLELSVAVALEEAHREGLKLAAESSRPFGPESGELV